jgi:hypothetical protein
MLGESGQAGGGGDHNGLQTLWPLKSQHYLFNILLFGSII